ncbi:MAG: thermonuclease family protein [Sulfitobacter sp.]
MVVLLSALGRLWRAAFLAAVGVGAVACSVDGLHANLPEVLQTTATDHITGAIRVIDADTFEISGIKIRLHAIDAPETDQNCKTEQGKNWACGGWVIRAVTDRYDGAWASCEALEQDRYGRTVARCAALGGDVGAWLVSEGMAFAYVKYGDDYAEIEKQAAAVDRGLHAVRMQTPAQHRLTRAKGRIPRDSNCKIKGNISADGKRIYHQPGQAFYERAGINEAKGERWFCNAAAAEAAGWRASRR